MVYSGPVNNPGCWPVVTTSAPGSRRRASAESRAGLATNASARAGSKAPSLTEGNSAIERQRCRYQAQGHATCPMRMVRGDAGSKRRGVIVTKPLPNPYACGLHHVGDLVRLEQPHPLRDIARPAGAWICLHTYRPSGDTDRVTRTVCPSSSSVLLGNQPASNGRRVQEVDHEPASRSHRGDHLAQSKCVLGVMLEISEAGKQIDREIHRRRDGPGAGACPPGSEARW